MDRKLVDDIVEYLSGSCKSEHDAAEAFSISSEEGEIEVCETCGWWVECAELDDDGNCTDCSTENE
jgi:hypothetical protein